MHSPQSEVAQVDECTVASTSWIAHWAVVVDEKPQVGVAYIICIPGPHIRLVNGPRVDLQCAMSTPALTLSQSPRLRLNASCYIFDIPPYAPPSPTHM